MAQFNSASHIQARTNPAAVRLGRISYLNVLPVYYGIDNGLQHPGVQLTSSAPSVLNGLMAAGKLDIGPVSSAAYARNSRDWLILPDLSISCFGPVMSVRLASRYPLKDLHDRPVALTQDSAAATALVQWIFSHHEIRPIFSTRSIHQPDDLPRNTAAALVIGNVALSPSWDNRFDYVWDLGEMWRDITGLPFVFALWAVGREFAAKHPERVRSVMELLYHSRIEGMRHIEEIAQTASKQLGLPIDAARLYYECLHYDLGGNEMKGLEAFFNGLSRKGLVPEPAEIRFFAPHHGIESACTVKPPLKCNSSR